MSDSEIMDALIAELCKLAGRAKSVKSVQLFHERGDGSKIGTHRVVFEFGNGFAVMLPASDDTSTKPRSGQSATLTPASRDDVVCR